MNLSKSYLVFKRVLKNYFINSRNSKFEKFFIIKLSRFKIKWKPSNKKIVLAAIVDDFAMAIKIASASHYLAKSHDANIGLYSIATQVEDLVFKNNKFWDSIYSEVWYKKLDNIFLSFGGKLLYRNVYNNKYESIERELRFILSSIKSKEDVIAIKIQGIQVGDLVYDTYMRMGNRATVDIHDPFLIHNIKQALYIYYGFNNVLERYELKAIVNSYTAYIQFGINVRLALNKGIPVYTVGSNNNLVHRVHHAFFSHHNNHFSYKKCFYKLEEKEEKLANAKRYFEKRFSGQVDAATSYMKSSAFNSSHNSKLDNIDWNNVVIVLAHCFFDSPHIYRDLLFPDFYEWITFTIDKLSMIQGISILIKPHPNGVEQNDAIFEQLKLKYSSEKVIFIDKHTSQLQLLNAKPKAIVTAYGTAASEFAYAGIPVVSIYDNPFTAYGFTKIAYSISEYESLLSDIQHLTIEIDKNEILEYYYMHHLYYMGSQHPDWLEISKYKGATNCDNFLIDYLPKMNTAYFSRIDNIISDGIRMAEQEYNDVDDFIKETNAK